MSFVPQPPQMIMCDGCQRTIDQNHVMFLSHTSVMAPPTEKWFVIQIHVPMELEKYYVNLKLHACSIACIRRSVIDAAATDGCITRDVFDATLQAAKPNVSAPVADRGADLVAELNRLATLDDAARSAKTRVGCPHCGYPDTYDGQHFKGIYEHNKPCPHCKRGVGQETP
jgi:hypothetical protein